MLAIGASKAENHLCAAIPGCNYDKHDQIWRAPLSWPAYVCFRTAWAAMPIAISGALLDYGARAWADVQDRYAWRTRIDAPGEYATAIEQLEATPAGGGQHLRPDQRGGVAWLLNYGRAGIEDPTGNGKTPIFIRALQLQQLMSESALPALYIGNGSALLAIRDKFAAWAPELRVSVVSGAEAARRKALAADADVYLLAWSNVRYHTRLAPYGSERLVRCQACGGTNPKTTPGRCEAHEKELNAKRFGTVIVDEAHKLRDPKTKQTRAVWWLMWHCEFCWPVTGTLVADNVGDPWGPMHGLDPKAWPSRSRYLDMFAVKDYAWHKGADILGFRPEHAYAAHSIIQPYWRRIPKEVARPFQPPRLEPEFRYPEMSPKQAAAYRQLTKELLADLEGATLVSENDLTKYVRCCQLAASMVEQYDGEDAAGFTVDRWRLALPSSKADDLMEFIDTLPEDEPLVVAAISPELIKLAAAKLHEAGISHTSIIGGMSPQMQYEANMDFQQRKARVIFINAAGAESIDLQAASTIYFMEPDSSFLQREQKIGRIDRYGQVNAVRQVYALSPGTVDKHRYKLGCDKAERHNSVARDPDLMRWILSEESVDWATGT